MDLHTWMLADLGSLRSKLFDSVIERVSPERWHEPADGGGSTITHLLLHLARHQDLAVQGVVRDHEPLFHAHRQALGLANAPAGTALAEREDRQLTTAVAAEPLLAYVTAVFDATIDWLTPLGSMALDIEPNTDHRLTTRAGLDPAEYPWLYTMWRGRAVWWFVQWPVLGHGHAHVGEAISVRNRMGLSPF